MERCVASRVVRNGRLKLECEAVWPGCSFRRLTHAQTPKRVRFNCSAVWPEIFGVPAATPEATRTSVEDRIQAAVHQLGQWSWCAIKHTTRVLPPANADGRPQQQTDPLRDDDPRPPLPGRHDPAQHSQHGGYTFGKSRPTQAHGADLRSTLNPKLPALNPNPFFSLLNRPRTPNSKI